MSDFDTRPKGTVMHGAFRTFASAERALRVLKNAGYLRSEVDPAADDSGGLPAVVTVDAAATGAVRAAEILEEHGAELHYASGTAALVKPAPITPVPPSPPPPEAKAKIRKSARAKFRALEDSLPRNDVVIKTRGSDVMPLGESFVTPETLGKETESASE